MSRHRLPPDFSASRQQRFAVGKLPTTQQSLADDGSSCNTQSSSQVGQYDSLRRNYRPLPPCQEILASATNSKTLRTSHNNAADEEEDSTAASVRLVNRFITNNEPANQSASNSPRQKTSHQRHKASSGPKENSKDFSVNLKRSPKRQTGLKASATSSSKPNSVLEVETKPQKPNNNNSSASFDSRVNHIKRTSLVDTSTRNKTFPTEASFLLSEETALLTSSPPTTQSKPATFNVEFGPQEIAESANRHPSQFQCVDINHLSQLQPLNNNSHHGTSPAASTSSSILLQQLATTNNRASYTSSDTTPSPHLVADNAENFDGDDEETLSSSDFTANNTIYSTASEYEDETAELEEQLQSQQELLDDYEYYLQLHGASSAKQPEQHPQQIESSTLEFATNISVLAQQHDRRNLVAQPHLQQSRPLCVELADEKVELQPYEASFQQLLGAFESQLFQQQQQQQQQQHNHQPPAITRQQTFVAMDGKTHILEQSRQQHSSLPSGMTASDHQMKQEITIQQPAKTGERNISHIQLQQLRSSSFPAQQPPYGTSSTSNMQDNKMANSVDFVDGSSLQQSMMNIESSLHRLNEAGGSTSSAASVIRSSAAHSTNHGQNFPPNTLNATSQSWAAGQQQQPNNNIVILDSNLSSSAHQEHAARNRPYSSTQLFSRVWSSCAFVYPKKPLNPALIGIPLQQQSISIAAAPPPQPPVDPWEIPFDAIKSLEWKGAGAQGAVFVGLLAGQRVAVKKVCTRREVDEIRPFRRLQHANIIRLLGVCTQELCYSIVMEYCQYGSLYDYISQHNRILPEQLLVWTKQIAGGMHYLHTNKIIHRDLKSPNVLLSDKQTVKISDFGTSKFAATSSTSLQDDTINDGDAGKKSPTTTIAANAANKTWSFVGTVSWMAPEVIRGEAQNEKVDTWAFGVILWEMLFGLPPYPGVEDASAIMWGVGSEILTLPIPDNIPQGLRLLMLQCWSSKPRNRPTFKNIQIHLDIAAPDVLEMQPVQNGDEEPAAISAYAARQDQWREQIFTMLNKEVDSALKHSPRVLKAQELAILEQRKKELRHAQDIRMHYERKLERANNLYLEMTTCMLQLEQRERELVKREQRLSAFLNKDCRPKLAKRRILKAMLGSNSSAGSSNNIDASYNASSSAYRWASSAHTTPIAHKLHTHHEYSLDANATAHPATNGNNHMSISLDRGILQSSGGASNRAMLDVVGPHNTMPAHNSNKTIIERTIVKSKHRILKSAVGVNQQVTPTTYVTTKRMQAKYDSNATPDALFEDRPFRRSKRAIRGSNSSTSTTGSAAPTAHGVSGTHVRRRRRHNLTDSAVNEAAVAAGNGEKNASVIIDGKIAEISPDLFKGLPRQRQAASLLLANGVHSAGRTVIDAGVQCRLLGAPLPMSAPTSSSSSAAVMASIYSSSTSTSLSDLSNNNISKNEHVELSLDENVLLRKVAEEHDEQFDGQSSRQFDSKIKPVQQRRTALMSRRNQSDTFDVNDKKNEDEVDGKGTAFVDDIDCIVPDIDENDVGDHDDEDDEDDNLSDREHQVSVMRQRLSSGQMQLTTTSSSSSSAESSESEEVASDATVSLSGPSVTNLEDCTIDRSSADATAQIGQTVTTEKMRANDFGTIRKPTSKAAATGGSPSGVDRTSNLPASKIPVVNLHHIARSRSPTVPLKYPDERPSGMFSSDAARAATKLRPATNASKQQ